MNISRIKDIWQGHHRSVRFILVGLWNTVVGYGVYFCALYGLQAYWPDLPKPYLWAMTAAQVLGVLNAYVSHRRLTFSDRRSAQKKMEFGRFVLVYLATLLLTFVLMPVLVENLHVRADLAGVINIMVATVFSYTAHQRFTFRPTND
jgi:putative flippase GtrA